MKCANCNDDFNDGVQCGACKKHLDFGCANITESGWRRLGKDKKAAWKCPSCRVSSPMPSPAFTSEQVSLETILSEIRALKAQLAGIPSLTDDVKAMREELNILKISTDFIGNQIDDFSKKVAGLESRVAELEVLQDKMHSLQIDLDQIKSELSANDQRSRLNNVEIKGIPVKKDENLFTILDNICRKINYSFARTQINYIYRIPLFNTKEKSIVVSFLNRYIKEDFIAAARSIKNLSAHDLGFATQPGRVYVNDHLSPDSKKLLNKTRALAKEKEFKYIWVKHGKIHIRKDEGTQVFIITKEKDLNRLI